MKNLIRCGLLFLICLITNATEFEPNKFIGTYSGTCTIDHEEFGTSIPNFSEIIVKYHNNELTVVDSESENAEEVIFTISFPFINQGKTSTSKISESSFSCQKNTYQTKAKGNVISTQLKRVDTAYFGKCFYLLGTRSKYYREIKITNKSMLSISEHLKGTSNIFDIKTNCTFRKLVK